MAIFTPKFRVLGTIAPNLRFFWVKALKIFPFSGLVGIRSSLKGINFLGQGIESLEPEVSIQGNLEKTRNTLINEIKYRVVKWNQQVAILVDSEHVNENMVQNSSPTCKHTLFEVIKSKKFLVFGFGHVGICKKSKEVQIALCPSKLEKVGVIHDEVSYSKHAATPFTFLHQII